MDGWAKSSRSRRTVPYAWDFILLKFQQGQHSSAVSVRLSDTHSHLHSNAHKHKCYGSQGSAGVPVLKKVFVQLAASETASYRAGPTEPAWLRHSAVGWTYAVMKCMFYCAYRVHIATLDIVKEVTQAYSHTRKMEARTLYCICCIKICIFKRRSRLRSFFWT